MPTSTHPRSGRSLRVLLVTRHAGAAQWLQEHLQMPQAELLAHLQDASALSRGDLVAGNLPLALAAELCARGVVVLGIDLSLQPHQRGAELDAAEMRAAGASLQRYRVQTEPWPAGLHQAADAASHERLQHAGAKSGREK